jgi:hypothetical protein
MAEEVSDPDLVARDEEGKPYTVRYEAVNAMVLNEFLKEHRKVEEQAATIEQKERGLTELERAVAELHLYKTKRDRRAPARAWKACSLARLQRAAEPASLLSLPVMACQSRVWLAAPNARRSSCRIATIGARREANRTTYRR